ncbi:pyridoxamine 5'-phosphate oxidase family protein, partial [Rhizobium ruizarguesonis]
VIDADDETLHLPDWRGNNRVYSLSNIVRDPRLALMFLIPGSNTTTVRGCLPSIPKLESSASSSEKTPRPLMRIVVFEPG